MAFWHQSDIEPKRSNRWVLILGWLDPFLISSFKKPSFQISHSEYQIINDVYYKPNVLAWNESTCSIVDLQHASGIPVKLNATKVLFDKLTEIGAKWPSDGFPQPVIKRDRNGSSVGEDPDNPNFRPGGFEPNSSITKADMNFAFGIIKFQQLKADGKPFEEWKLFNTSLVSADFGEASYDKDEINKINLTFKYDYATFTTLK